jgi:hypothetical protein
MVLGEIMNARTLVTGSTNSASRWICQPWSLLLTIVYLEVRKDNFIIACYCKRIEGP